MSDARRRPAGESPDDGAALLAFLQEEAARLGIDRLAVADPARRPDPAVLDGWLADGLHAGMTYLERHRELRLDPNRLMPGVRSIISVALGYASNPGVDPEAAAPHGPRVARYALGRDYHHVLRRKLEALVARLRERRPGLRTRIAVDTAPVLERHWAVAAGLGWWGKHGCVIVPGLGSWVFLGEIFLDAPLPFGVPLVPRCGDCDRCLRACPTGALVGPARLDTRRCIAYWTIEHRGDFPPEAPRLSPWLFGCDRCQEVCPWNRDVRPAVDPELAPFWPDRPGDLQEWLALDATSFARHFKPTAMERAGLAGLQRNARRLASEAEEGREP